MLKYIKILSLWLPLVCFAQNQQLDSLKTALKTAKNDTTKCIILLACGEKIHSNDPEAALDSWTKAAKLADENLNRSSSSDQRTQFLHKRFLSFYASALNGIGFIKSKDGNTSEAIENYTKSLKIFEELADKKNIANGLNNIGFIYFNQGNVQRALDYYKKSLKLREEMRDSTGIATAFNNIGLVHSGQNDLPMALEYYKKSLQLRLLLGKKQNIASSYNNIGFIYKKSGSIDSALFYYKKSLQIREGIGDKNGTAGSLANIGAIYAFRNETDTALIYYIKSLKIRTEIKDKAGIAASNINIGRAYFYQKKYDKALEFSLEAMRIGKELGFPENIRNAADLLHEVYKAKNNHLKALENYEIYIKMRDSITNQDTKKASIKSQLNYEYEKKAAADSVKVAEEKKLTAVQLRQEKNQRYFLYSGLALTLIFGAFMFNRFRITQKQKNIIEEQKTIVEMQKHIVEEKQKEVLDSIHYARRIQTSLLPTEKYIDRNLKTS